MFAYVKFNEKCSRHDEKKIVPVANIKHFDTNVGNTSNKSYKVKCGTSYCTGIIIFVEDTLEKLKNKIATKRPIVPPKNLIESASDVTASDCDIAEKSPKKLAAENKVKNTTKKMLENKMNQLRKDHALRKTRAATLENKENMNKQSRSVPATVQHTTTSVKKQGSNPVKRKPTLDTSDQNKSYAPRSSNNNSAKRLMGNTAKKVKPNTTDGIDEENATILNSHTTQGKSNYVECNNLDHINLVEEIKYLEGKCERNEKKMIEQELMIKDLTKLNMELQRDILLYFEEFKVTAKQYEGVVRNLEGADTPPTGYIRRADNTIHLGRNVWIPKMTYDAALCGAKTSQLFVKNMALAVFGHQVLQTSSVTGTKCNKYKDRQPKPKLDETKVLAIQDIFRYWLINVKKCTECTAQLEVCRVQLYISRKIADMNRSAAAGSKQFASSSTTDDVSTRISKSPDSSENPEGDENLPTISSDTVDEMEDDKEDNEEEDKEELDTDEGEEDEGEGDEGEGDEGKEDKDKEDEDEDQDDIRE